MHQEYQSCIAACQTCAVECEHCATACLKEPDATARVHCIQLLRDCADICDLSARWMGRGSNQVQQTCQMCADLCDACAAECARFKDEHCQRCAAECRTFRSAIRSASGWVPGSRRAA